jgi:DNA primase
MALLPKEFIDEIKERVPIEDVIGKYVPSLQRQRNGQFKGLSPFKDEKTPSFYVTPARRSYHCFSTNKSGDIFSFLEEKERLSLREAAFKLADEYGIPRPQQDHTFSPSQKRDLAVSKAAHDIVMRINQTFTWFLTEAEKFPQAREYLQSRNISEQAMRKFQLGFCPPSQTWLFNFLTQKRGYSAEAVAASGLVLRNRPKNSLFAGRVTFPIRDWRGKIIGYGGRLLAPHERLAKYINSGETKFFKKSQAVFGLFEQHKSIMESGSVVITEGYLDVIALDQIGITNVVAPMGTAFTEDHVKEIKRYADQVVSSQDGRGARSNGQAILVFDGDQAGREACRKAIRTCELNGLHPKIVPMPDGIDPADMAQEYPDQLHELIRNPIQPVPYIIADFSQDKDLGDPEVKQGAIHAVSPYLASIQSPVKREASIMQAADILGVSAQAIFHEIQSPGEPSIAVQKQPSKKKQIEVER